MKPPLSSQRDRRPESSSMPDRPKKSSSARIYEPLDDESKKQVLDNLRDYLNEPRVKLALRLEKQFERKLSEFYFGEDDPFATKH